MHERKIEITEKHRAMFAEMLKEGTDPLSFWCDVLSDENAPMEHRREAAAELLPYHRAKYRHARLPNAGPLIERFAK